MTADQTSEQTLLGRHLTRAFGQGEMKTTALNDVSITLERGHVALLMGPSGSGKSTLLAVLSGLLHPDNGQVTSLGHDIWKMSEAERERFRLKHCGFIFQGYNLFTALSARQQLEMVLRWGQGVSAKESRRRTDDMLGLLGLGNKAHLRPSEMSGGEKQRVAIGRALIKEPEFCFADEPTSALDWAHGEQVIELLRNAAHERGATVLIVAHDARIIPYVDRVYNLEDGCLRDGDDDSRHEPHEHADGRNGELTPRYPSVH
ncbi:MAG TPA: ABC transporter ATP-binding protein [Gemmataceae bacterium]|nr:ABC transporter ATP-binding protein [Gemmataceae bacterium]